MASTDQRAGFRLPWSGSTPQDEDGAAAPGDAMPEATTEQMTDEHAEQPAEANAEPSHEQAAEQPPETHVEASAPVAIPIAAAAPAAGHKPARFVTELVRAMRAELEKHRETTLEQFRVDAKQHVETVHTRSADEVAELRRIADDDIAGIKEWSKAEMARIRAETEERVEGRKTELEGHLEEHAALIEREIEKVQARVTAYEAEIDTFFKSLETIDDPAAFAAAAQQVPEPPSLEEAGAEARSEALADLVRGRPMPDLDAPFDPSVTPEVVAAATDGDGAAEMQPVAEASAEPAPEATPEFHPEASAEAMTAEAQAAEAQPAANAADAAEAQAEAEAEAAAEAVAEAGDTQADDPRLAALAMSEDLAAAESAAAGEAATAVAEEAASSEPVPEIEADIVAARLNGLVPEGDASLNGVARPAPAAAPEGATTQIIVVGLVSVASIASFKRQVSRLPGIHSVGVSSGPDGEFIFKASHDPNLVLQDLLPTLTGYAVRVVSTGDGIINVSARDPEN